MAEFIWEWLIHSPIKFTAKYLKKANFPDFEVICKNNQLHTDLYVKPTDTH